MAKITDEYDYLNFTGVGEKEGSLQAYFNVMAEHSVICSNLEAGDLLAFPVKELHRRAVFLHESGIVPSQTALASDIVNNMKDAYEEGLFNKYDFSTF